MDYGTSNGFFSFASELAKQLTQDAIELSATAMELSASAVETAKYIAHESTAAVEKATLLAQEALAEHFPDEAPEDSTSDVAPDDLVTLLPWINEDGSVHENVQDDVLEISWDLNNFNVLTHDELAPIFDIDRYLLVAPQLLAFDAHLRQRHFESARKIPEDVFWGNYFYMCHVARLRHGLSPYVASGLKPLPSSPLSSTASESLLPLDRSFYDSALDSPDAGRPTSVSMPELLESAHASPTIEETKRKAGLHSKLKRSMSSCKERLAATDVHKYMDKVAHFRAKHQTSNQAQDDDGDAPASRFQRWSQTSRDLKSSLRRHSVTSSYLKTGASLPASVSSAVQKLPRWVPGRGLRSKSLSVSEMQHLRDIQARLYASDAPILESPPPLSDEL
ncbi:hypothetical protein SPRG_08461 [Saprolegnia parasitica CBS 223.65]|uniref:BSD domain-containing protein n=1 Tax=Saprolegnia parasitica (strain CBS 223.65) TaxID=695850 RepID=A0A067CA93_SAPPC|nr:hypothetical protein SPRG_08461 [Saprolegnia parasitica CBS 223.65]KDO26100.1 hypothetical protein SPRG_08461 [Saprolegnia parasitica CBS 223.65]|eukprot:XP_012203096.1 hypothetical protein SPRG_08461 [Saprolegnia parasitica CBS 223.65]